MTRIVIAGGPRTGKTTLAGKLQADFIAERRAWLDVEALRAAMAIRHTDDVKDMDWSEASAIVATWFDEPGPWIIEGVSTVRALRKWLKTHESGAPCDVLIWLWEPHVERTKEQEAMAKGIATIWNEVVHSLRDRGVEIRHGAP